MGTIRAELLQNRVIVWNHEEGSSLYKEGFYGKPLGIRKPKSFEFNRPLELSLFETLYLLSKNKIEVYDKINDKMLDSQNLLGIAIVNFVEFEEKFRVYCDLRDRGYIVRPGLKFGADFAVYQHGPGIDHAPFIVHCLQNNTAISSIEMVRAGRLATTVRKKFIIATISMDKVIYYMFTWFKP
ncbi:MAG TPA: tRNA-intron lyase [Candidatus Deferrimicrobium sp.]|nr:tRNA-intron lyase [Candidatus Deferrimicrobium sp.]